MKVQFNSIYAPGVYQRYPQRRAQSVPSFGGIRLPSSGSKNKISYVPARFNPVTIYINALFERSLEASRRRLQTPLPEIRPYIKEVKVKSPSGGTNYMWDINKDNRTKYLMFLHGSSQNITNNQTLYKQVIEKTDFAVLAPEYSGFGKNKSCTISQKSVLGDTLEALDYLTLDKKIKPENVFVMGHSFGGFAATQLVRNNQNVGRLILVSSIDTLAHESVNVKNALRHKVPPIINFLFKNFKMFRKPLMHVFNTNQQLRNINTPVDIIHAQNDRLVKPRSSESLGEMCKHLHSITILPTGGHGLEASKIETVVSILNDKR